MQKVFPIKIEEAVFEQLEVVPNSFFTSKVIQIVDPEFSSVCPRTGLPDYGRVILQYIPGGHCVELKAWKLYLRSFYGVGCFHEDCTQRIINDFVAIVQPKFARITIDWGARGGLHTTTQLTWADGGYNAHRDDFLDPVFMRHARDWNNQ